MTSKNHEVLRVCRTKAQAKKAYDRISRFYDYFAGVFERKYRDRALELLAVGMPVTAVQVFIGVGQSNLLTRWEYLSLSGQDVKDIFRLRG